MSDNEEQQLRFGEQGELEEPTEDDDDEPQLLDDGSEREGHVTKGGFNSFEVMSLFQKSCRRGDRKRAMWAAFELGRSSFGGQLESRIYAVLIEDLRLSAEEAHIPSAVEHLLDLAKNRWSMDSGMGLACLMRIASILAEATSSHEILLVKNYWNDIAEERMEALNAGEKPEKDFPVAPDLSDVEFQTLDTHTYRGSGKGRGTTHFWTVASRTANMTDLEIEAKRGRMECADEEFSEAEYEQALSPVEGEDRWPEEEGRQNQSLDEVDE